MVYITREENGQLILEEVRENNLLLEAKIINGETWYKSLNTIEVCTINPEYDHLETEEIEKKFYFKDVDALGYTKRIYVLELQEWFYADDGNLKLESFNGNLCIDILDVSGKVKGKFVFFGTNWRKYSAKYDHLECQEINGQCYTNDVDDRGRVKRTTTFGVDKWIEVSCDCLELQEFHGKVHINGLDESGRVKYKYIDKFLYCGRWEEVWIKSKYDHLAYEEFNGKCYIIDVNECKKVKRILEWSRYELRGINSIDFLTYRPNVLYGEYQEKLWLEAECDHLSFEEFRGETYINDVDSFENVKRKFFTEERKYKPNISHWIESKYDYLACEEFRESTYINDIKDGKVKRKYINDQGWFESFHDHYEWNQHLTGRYMNDVDGAGSIRAMYLVDQKRWRVSTHDHLEWEIFHGLRIKDIDRDGKVKTIYMEEWLKNLSTEYDHLEMREFDGSDFVYDVDKNGKDRRIYDTHTTFCWHGGIKNHYVELRKQYSSRYVVCLNEHSEEKYRTYLNTCNRSRE